MNDNSDDSSDMTERIEIFSTDDEKIKSFGELLTNDSSRAILKLIFKNEITATQIAQQTDISLQLVKYHINKMQDMNIAKVARVEKNQKGQDMKFYTATKFAIVILPSSVKEKAKESKSLLRSFKTIYKFAGVGIASVSSFFFAHMVQNEPQRLEQSSEWTSSEEAPTHSGIEDFKDSSSGEASPTMAPVPESEPESGFDLRVNDELMEAPAPEPEPQPEPELAPDQFTGDSSYSTLEESLELASRKMEATAASGADSGNFFGAESFWPLIVAIGVAGIGLALIYFWKAYKQSKKQQKQKVAV